MSDYYQLLGVGYDASQEDISKSFKKLAVKYHPDKSKDPKHHEVFIQLNQAYETLKSQDTRRQYDIQHNFNTKSSSLHEFFTTSGYTDAYTHPRYTSYDRGSKFAWSQFKTHFTTSDLLQKQRQAYAEKVRRDVELKKAQEKAEREREALRQEMERVKLNHLEKLREMKEAEQARNKEQQQARQAATTEESGDFDANMYNQRKKQAYRAQWSEPLRAYDGDIFETNFARRKKPVDPPQPNSSADFGHKGNQFDPIVVDDDTEVEMRPGSVEVEEIEINTPSSAGPSGSSSMGTAESDHESSSSGSSVDANATFNDNDDDNENYDNNVKTESDEEEHHGSYSEPIVVEEPGEKNETSGVSSPSSPKRNLSEIPQLRPSKRAKVEPFSMNDLHASLGPDIGSDNLSNLRESLPNYSDNEQKPSGTNQSHNSSFKTSKRHKVAEYSDGTSKAETLHTPINKSQTRGYGYQEPVGMSDFNASTIVNAIRPPNPPSISVNHHLTKTTWDGYVRSMLSYQQKFIEYRTKIINYQAERASRDSELIVACNQNIDLFQLYLKCLDQDSVVLTRFAENIKVFNQTLKDYKNNCDWVEKIKLLS
ncbi:hypothetical protein PSN45_000976 [Yamadazyma tenuis]|uniref:DnaJ-domain-containing protein n=1 Tax=Candida tenuis (strain ATCC 10573 / BCRC 21748 / CBS 615 / JCM 9827 / NBRC 10315 / NRRL Y-1498 / VKM Y-70) TaxID=590646 RepID=G3B7E3_CANTC|nr:DnaJ-domain-containing protein [Yamadazyma tenuis ATCC 10573]EGV62253.1 DnaJ-domain-containing protein [Yamadazyma tenuis ATCC 10573]WEJ93511.1 hypothetical protein PSN45_000976 [Yamadazyma tenuis]